mmetsp:Transcript_18064/g.44631  ORF Transcript_18064/g.44631 Transcript_18064/m.44631 type:complete len:212 (-) Transcript_18064:3526-4161(-)
MEKNVPSGCVPAVRDTIRKAGRKSAKKDNLLVSLVIHWISRKRWWWFRYHQPSALVLLVLLVVSETTSTSSSDDDDDAKRSRANQGLPLSIASSIIGSQLQNANKLTIPTSRRRNPNRMRTLVQVSQTRVVERNGKQSTLADCLVWTFLSQSLLLSQQIERDSEVAKIFHQTTRSRIVSTTIALQRLIRLTLPRLSWTPTVSSILKPFKPI